MYRILTASCFAAFLLLLPICSSAQTLKEAVQKAVLTNPEVQAKWHSYQSSNSERSAVVGAYFPEININAIKGRDNNDNRLGSTEFNRTSTAISLNQMIYDGFLTKNEVERFDHLRLVRLYELQDATETIALEVARAYYDVVRYRKLVTLSEENYIRHRSVFELIQAKSKAGVGRRVDLEQISGRLALAESNLLTETSNLHDVSTRFQRLVGSPPEKDLDNPALLTTGIPSDLPSSLNEAFTKNPTLLATIENILSVNSSISAKRSAFQPKLNFRAQAERGNNIDRINGRTNNNTAEFVLSWNLFNGGSDKARLQQAADQVNVAKDLRDKTCRDIRQTLLIAFNDTSKLTEQLTYLDQHQLSIEKARDAYRQQFDIGQRSLLDLLDTENELFQAKRAFANAEIDLNYAYARTHAVMGSITSALGVSRNDIEAIEQLKSANTLGEMSQNCPTELTNHYIVNKTSLNARALEGISSAILPLKTTPIKVKPTKTINDNHIAASRTTILNALKGWREAWISMNPDAYFDFYSKKYVSRDSWKSSRRARLLGAKNISLDLTDIQFKMQDENHAVTIFQQDYKSSVYQDTLIKTLHWAIIDGKWKIVDETVSGPNAKQW
jgi:adhesin transport system outer membrane protein